MLIQQILDRAFTAGYHGKLSNIIIIVGMDWVLIEQSTDSGITVLLFFLNVYHGAPS